MKKILYIFCLLFVLSSCKFLDVVPTDTATIDDAFANEENCQKFLHSIYGHIGNMNRYWMPGQIMGGDDLITSSKGTTRWYGYKSILYNEETSTVTFHNFMKATGAPTGGVNYDYYTAIRYCYMLLDRVGDVPGISDENRAMWAGEAWFMIGFFHWGLLEYYGPIVIVDHEISLNATEAELYCPRTPFDECVDFICECFDKAIELLPARQPNAKWYGRATAAAAYGYKARTLLFAASPLFNGDPMYADLINPDGSQLVNQTYDPEKWKRAMEAAEDAIKYCEANGYYLWENAEYATAADDVRGERNFHDFLMEKWNDPEYLMAFPHTNSQAEVQLRSGLRKSLPYSSNGWRTSNAPLWNSVMSYYTKNGLPLEDDPLTKTKNLYQYNAQAETAELNLNREPRFYACVGYNRGDWPQEGGTMKIQAYAGEVHGYIIKDGKPVTTNEYVNETGYFLKKVMHEDCSYDETTKTLTYHNFAWPMMRLSEMYLSYAEAQFEYDGTLSQQSLNYLDLVRHRCGLPNFKDSWAIVGGIPTGEKLRKVLHQERSNELMFEGHRYRDIRRWKIAEECYATTFTCWNVWGTNPEEYYQLCDYSKFDLHGGTIQFITPKSYLLPIPLSEIQINSQLVQNPGY